MDGETPSYRDSHQGCGRDYHDRFSENPRRRMMWEIEQQILASILEEHYRDAPPDHLDFACGTGRVLEFLLPRTASATGVDISASMLAIAGDQLPAARLIKADLTRDASALRDRRFDLVTVFRFFPNAEPRLRSEAMGVLVEHLQPGGRLVFNNHRCLSSLRHRLVRGLTLGRHGKSGMSRGEVVQLVAEAGLEIERVCHAGVVPEYEWLLLRPRWLIERIERLATRLPLSGLAENLVYVCRKPGPEAAGQRQAA